MWPVGQAVNRNGGGVGAEKFRLKFQSSIAEISKRHGAAFPVPPLTLVLTENSVSVVCSAPVLEP